MSTDSADSPSPPADPTAPAERAVDLPSNAGTMALPAQDGPLLFALQRHEPSGQPATVRFLSTAEALAELANPSDAPDTRTWWHFDLFPDDSAIAAASANAPHSVAEWVDLLPALSALSPDVQAEIREALIGTEDAPRCRSFGPGLLLSMRGINLNKDARPEDLVSLRMWAEADRIVSIRRDPVESVREVRRAFADPAVPMDTGDVIAALVDALLDRIVTFVDGREDSVDDLEESTLHSTDDDPAMRNQLTLLRRETVVLRRHGTAQRDVLMRLAGEKLGWFHADARDDIRLSGERMGRLLDDVAALRERAHLLVEELQARGAHFMGIAMYRIAMLSAIFLPLTFVTGLLGMNVGGIPASESEYGLVEVLVVLAVLVAAQVYLFRKWRWL